MAMTTAKAVAMSVPTAAWDQTMRSCSFATFSFSAAPSWTPMPSAMLSIFTLSLIPLQQNSKVGRAAQALAAAVVAKAVDLLHDRQPAQGRREFAKHLDDGGILENAKPPRPLLKYRNSTRRRRLQKLVGHRHGAGCRIEIDI